MGASLGLIIYLAVKPIFKIYFIIGLGFLLARKNILSVSTCRDLSDAVIRAFMPCLIFNNVVSNLKSSDIKNLGVVFFEGTVLYCVGGLLGLATYYVCHTPKAWFGGLLSVGLFPNISDLPIAYLQTLSKGSGIFTEEQGNLGVAYVCIFLASQVFFQYSLGFYRIVGYDFRDCVKDLELTRIGPATTHALTTATSLATSTTHKTVDLREKEADQHNQFLMVHKSALSDLSSDSFQLARRNSTVSDRSNPQLTHTLSRVGISRMRSQDIDDVIQEYSEAHRMNTNTLVAFVIDPDFIVAEEQQALPEKGKIEGYLYSVGKSFLSPSSVSLIVSLAVAMAPPLKALFVKTSFYMPDAPDKMPPLSFVIDITSYIGAACVPLGLLLLGATIARLRVNKFVPGFWKTALMITICRLIILPIFGVGFTTGIYKAGWFGDDKLIRFVSVLEFGLPNATALVYFTALYTDPNSTEHLQMDCLAICLMAQYAILFITLPFLVTFSLKVSMGM